MSRKCKAFAHLDDQYYPEHNCVTTGTPPESMCDECLAYEELPRLRAEVERVREIGESERLSKMRREEEVAALKAQVEALKKELDEARNRASERSRIWQKAVLSERETREELDLVAKQRDSMAEKLEAAEKERDEAKNQVLVHKSVADAAFQRANEAHTERADVLLRLSAETTNRVHLESENIKLEIRAEAAESQVEALKKERALLTEQRDDATDLYTKFKAKFIAAESESTRLKAERDSHIQASAFLADECDRADAENMRLREREKGLVEKLTLARQCFDVLGRALAKVDLTSPELDLLPLWKLKGPAFQPDYTTRYPWSVMGEVENVDLVYPDLAALSAEPEWNVGRSPATKEGA